MHIEPCECCEAENLPTRQNTQLHNFSTHPERPPWHEKPPPRRRHPSPPPRSPRQPHPPSPPPGGNTTYRTPISAGAPRTPPRHAPPTPTAAPTAVP
nr:MAG TPA: hypothetical protein [Caudoviricetes sp.]